MTQHQLYLLSYQVIFLRLYHLYRQDPEMPFTAHENKIAAWGAGRVHKRKHGRAVYYCMFQCPILALASSNIFK